MKSTMLKSMLALLATSGIAFAADNGQITLEGTVPTINEIAITPQSGYNNLNIAGGATDQFVALVNERNNDPDGYTVQLQSLNASGAQARLKGDGSVNTTYVAYTMKYGVASSEVDVELTAGSAQVTSTAAPTGAGGVNKRLLVSFAGNSWPDAGIYSDTLTLTIASK